MKIRQLSILIITITLFISAFFLYQLKDVGFDFDFEKFFPTNSEDTQYYFNFREQFESDNDFILLAIKNEAGIFQQDFLFKIDSLTKQVETLPDVKSVYSPTNVKEFKRDRLTSRALEFPYLNVRNQRTYKRDSAKIYRSKHLVEALFSKDAKSVMLFIKNKELITIEGSYTLTNSIDSLLEHYNFDEVHHGGKPYGQTYFTSMIKREVGIFIAASVLFVILFLYVSYRKLWGVYLPLMIVGLTVLWTMGMMTFTGKKIDIISNIIPTLLMVIGISAAIHLLTNYLQNKQPHLDKWQVLKASIKEVGFATMLTTFTTAIGFMTLTTSSFISLQDLGWYATFGLFVAFILAYTLMPAVILLHPPLQQAAIKTGDYWTKQLEKAFEWTMNHQKRIVWISIGVVVLGLLGMSTIKVNNYILEDLRKDNPEYISFNFIADNFGGGRPCEFVATVRDTSTTVFHPAAVREMAQVDSFLKVDYGLTNSVSPAQLIKFTNQINHFGASKSYEIPESNEQIELMVRRLYRNPKQANLENFISEDKKTARITGRIPDIGSYIVRQQNTRLQAFIDGLPNRQLDYKITGTSHLMDLNNSYIAENILIGLLIAVGVIGLLFAWLMRSPKMMWITLVPNLLPLIFIAGVMGFVGVDLKISTSIIFIIAFGIAVDDSIHFLSRFRFELQKQGNALDALKTTYLTTGKAIVVTSIILTGGFLTLCLSSYLGTFYIGLLVAVTLFVALVADLTLLPVLLLYFYGKK